MTDQMPAKKLTYVENRGAIEIITLNRPEALNAMSPELADELSEYFFGLQKRRDVRVVLLRAEGRAFCSGGDLDSPAFAAPGPGRAQRQYDIQKRYANVTRSMRDCPQPIIALVQGAACGAGFSIALASDIRYCTPEAKFNAAYIRVGVSGTDMGSGYFLPKYVGLSVASEFLMTGRFISPQRALATGLVSDVVPADKLLETGLELAGDMLKTAPMGLRMTKESLNALSQISSIEAALALEDRQQILLMETADHREAIAAFKEKRAPNFTDT
jgi:enoyl-CoA hydratase/carnithine racemase